MYFHHVYSLMTAFLITSLCPLPATSWRAFSTCKHRQFADANFFNFNQAFSFPSIVKGFEAVRKLIDFNVLSWMTLLKQDTYIAFKIISSTRTTNDARGEEWGICAKEETPRTYNEAAMLTAELPSECM